MTIRVPTFLSALLILTVGIITTGCGETPTAPQSNVGALDAAPLPTGSNPTSSPMLKPGAQPSATPPSFPGWSVVNAYEVAKWRDPHGDTDYMIKFRVPGRTTRPRYTDVAAKNYWGVWNRWPQPEYVRFEGSTAIGSSYEMRYVVGKWKSFWLSINMQPGNWALYYHD